MRKEMIVLIHPDPEIRVLLESIVLHSSDYKLMYREDFHGATLRSVRVVLYLIKLNILQEMTQRQLEALKALKVTGAQIWIIGGSIGETIAIDQELASLMFRSGASLAVNITELVRTMRKHGFLSTPE